ncbi:MAG TPA: YIP1 family protein [Blastocatellia bacterium]|nr:YIP1 family protein [Blastocatellia bacterium]
MAPEDNFASQSATAVPAPEAAPQNFFNRLIGVWFSPGETFQDVGRAPRLVAPIIAAVLFGLIIGFVMMQRLDMQAMMTRMFEKAVAEGQMTQEQADQRIKFAASFGKVQLLLISALGSLLMSLIVAGIFKLVSMMMGSENRFSSLFAVTIYTYLAVSIVSSLVFVILLYLKDTSELTFENLGNVVSSNLGALLALALGEKALPKFVMALAQRVDLFSIWIITLLSIGYSAVSRRMKVSTAAIWLGGLYAVYALIVATLAAMRG